MIELKHYRFWVQSVLPLVYDNSLSYYEVLAKCVDYINNLIDNDNEMLASMEDMQGAIEELRQMIEDAGIADLNELIERVSTLETKTEDLPNYETNNPLMDGTASAGSSTKYSRGDHVHPTDASRASIESVNNVKNMISNKSLLVNGYFIGGGSQLGNGVFPINQRGQTIYTNGGDTIDRWRDVFSTHAEVSLPESGDCLRIANVSNSTRTIFIQNLALTAKELAGKEVTATILFKDGTLLSGSIVVPSPTSTSVYRTIIELSNNSVIRLSVSQTGVCGFEIVNGQEQTLDIVAVKLELGTEQTLAHQENGEWVLNELPNFGEELAKCQRYAINMGAGWSRYRAVSVGPSVVDFFVPLPVSPAASPTTTFINAMLSAGTAQIATITGGSIQTGFNCILARSVANGMLLRFEKSDHGLTDAVFQFNANAVIEFS